MMLRRSGVRALTASDIAAARALCDRDPIANVFVAARLDEGALGSSGAGLTVPDEDGRLRSVLWTSANVVPVGVSGIDIERYAARIRRAGRHRFSSIFGPADQVLPLWHLVARNHHAPMSLRPEQPLMVATRAPDAGVAPDDRVRPASANDIDAVVPAAAAMFTEEIGYAPFVGSDVAYRRSVAQLIAQGRTFVLMADGRVRFKADVGALASGVAQIQGVWIDPEWRGRGLAAPCMARVVELVQGAGTPTVSLYVNDYNVAAVRAYRAAGFTRVGTFATVIL